jgi:hypothetical protein
MLVWRSRTTDQTPPWLEGCPNVQHSGVTWWVGSALVRPGGNLLWHPCGKNYEVALTGGMELHNLQRENRWCHVGIIRDGSGVEWEIPQILDPEGSPSVVMANRLNPLTGEVEREPLLALHRSLIEAGWAYRSEAFNESERALTMFSLLEGLFHCNAASFGVLGVVDDVLLDKGLRWAYGTIAASDFEDEAG